MPVKDPTDQRLAVVRLLGKVQGMEKELDQMDQGPLVDEAKKSLQAYTFALLDLYKSRW